MKSRTVRLLSWSSFISAAIAVSLIVGKIDSLGGNYGGSIALGAFLSSAALFVLPLLGFLTLQRFHLRQSDADISRSASVIFFAGVAVWILLFAVLLMMRQASRDLALHCVWAFLSMCMFVMPLGAKLCAAAGRWNPSHALISSAFSSLLLVIMLAAFGLAPKKVVLSLGGIPAYVFSLALVLLYLSSLASLPLRLWLPTQALALLTAVLLRQLIFFQGTFYGGGMAPLLFFAICLSGIGVGKGISSLKGNTIQPN